MYRFSRRSLKKLEDAHVDLRIILLKAISISRVDFGISETHRSIKRQQRLFNEGKSKINGTTTKGKHNYKPSLAVDIYAWIQGKASWDDIHLGYIAGVILTIADALYDKGEVDHMVRFGGDWDMDGVFVIDQNLKDMSHFELIK